MSVCHSEVKECRSSVILVVSANMRRRLHMFPMVLLLPVAGCTIQRGNLDFANPWFDLHCGPITLIAFRSSTVLHVGTAYLTLSLPFYVPVILIIVLAGALWFAVGRRKYA